MQIRTYGLCTANVCKYERARIVMPERTRCERMNVCAQCMFGKLLRLPALKAVPKWCGLFVLI